MIIAMDTKRMHINYLDAKRPELVHGLAGKIALLILIVLVPGGLPLALSIYLCDRSKRAAALAPVRRWNAMAVRASASVCERGYRALQHWEWTL